MITMKNNEFIELTKFLKNNYGINLTHKKSLIEGRLNNVLSEKGFKSFSEYLDYVHSDITRKELTLLINKLTTNHTFFMREKEHFEFFYNQVLPYLSTKVKDRDLRIWSAGCSSGQEAYTLAMLIQEYFEEQKELWDKKVLATDISVNAIQSAVKGLYNIDDLQNIPNIWKIKYFKIVNNESCEIDSSIKKEVIFRIFNLMDEFPFKRKFHVIYCRNVMIYFDQETKDKLIKKFYDMTEVGGYLFIGLSESINRNDNPYEYVMPSVYRKG